MECGRAGASIIVAYWLQPQDAPQPVDDPHFTQGHWRDAEILAPPKTWGGGLPDGALPKDVRGINSQSGQPQTWPMRYALAHWAVLIKSVPAGKYVLRCRTIDANDVAQPLPRPFAKSGRNSIQQVELVVTEKPA